MSSNNFNPIDGGFLQSDQWEKFQNSVGKKTFRINEGSLTCLAIKYKLPLVGGYFFIPRGPVASAVADEVANYKSQIPNKIQNLNYKLNIKKFLNSLINIAKNNDIGWIRVEPQNFEDWEEIRKALEDKYTIKKSKKNHEPAQTLMLDLSQSEEEILAKMKPKTRYNIRLSQRKGVEFYFFRKDEDINSFKNLLKEAAQRDKISIHSEDYYQKMIEVISAENIELILAKADNQIIAGAMVIFYNDTATYLHGASSNEIRNLMAPFGVQWTAIKMAKEKGCKKYDFGGVSLETKNYKKVKRSWEGITRFKTGFCPKDAPVEFPGCWDIILNSGKYQRYRILQTVNDLVKFN